MLNLDIGGGTTNLAFGQAGEVRRTGCLFIGARHVQVIPGTYRMTHLSHYGKIALTRVEIGKGIGDELTEPEIARLVDFQVRVLEAAVCGDAFIDSDPAARQLVQRPYRPRGDMHCPVVTLSGGVGELVYAHLRGASWPGTTQFGDLGIELAQRIVRSDLLGRDLRTHIPVGGGRATVYGLLQHTTEVSGSTLFLPRPELLPLADLPVLGRVWLASTDADLGELLDRVARSPRGGCLAVSLTTVDADPLRTLGRRMAKMLHESAFPARHPLVLLVEQNVGKVLGHYATEWGQSPVDLIVVDEVPVRDAHYVQLGRLRDQVVPVSFHGLDDGADRAPG
jgi:ethanolamine utilization protein EutA